ncbi:hypothetical protein HDV00_010945 [Rhizophlyctis rosea]|nr:hypothetical protein HDV00_010945 [Rhizophlyctis rosea]
MTKLLGFALYGLSITSVIAQVPLYGQCGGQGYTGSTTCSSGTCTYSNPYYSQCIPGSGVSSSASSTKTTKTSTVSTTKTTKTTATTTTKQVSTTRTTTTTVSPPKTTTAPGGGGGISTSGVVGFATLGSGCSGGAGGPTVTVSTASALQAALSDDSPRIVYFNGALSNAGNITVGSNKRQVPASGSGLITPTLIGVGSTAWLDKSSLSIRHGTKNVIVRNIKFTLCTGGDNDCITIKDPGTSNIWVDHCDFSGDINANKDVYDGLIDVTREATYVTISYNYFHNHHKALLFGSSDSATEDAAIKINVRDGSQNLIEKNVFRNINKDVRSDGGYCVLVDNDLGGGSAVCDAGTFSSPPYSYTADSTATILSSLIDNAGVGKI